MEKGGMKFSDYKEFSKKVEKGGFVFVKKKQVIIGALLLAFSLITITPLQGWAMAAGESGTAVITEKSPPVGELSATDILSKSKIIAHGMGVAPGQEAGSTPLNCLEGFEAQYAAGVRVFEVDLRLTRDGKVVLRHDWWHSDWQEGISWTLIPTREDFVSKPILGKYTPLSFQDLLRLMERYPDICIITDTKFTDSDVFSIQFDSMMEDARELGLTYLFGRIVIQFYSENMCVALNNIYAYPHYIYTLYMESFDCSAKAFREKAAYCASLGIEAITMDESRWRDSFASIADEYGIKVYIHTVNDKDKAQKLLDAGVDGIYTDSLTPETLGLPVPSVTDVVLPGWLGI
jgi:glycerophosphoryl diester phosphodiesterase